MKAVAAMVTSGGVLADVGTDHGYIPIALIQRQKIKSAIAMDINKGPLAHAQDNIASAQLGDYIQHRPDCLTESQLWEKERQTRY